MVCLYSNVHTLQDLCSCYIFTDLVAYWSRVSPITDLLETEYLIECLTSEIDQYSTLISWTVNGHSIPNMNYTLLHESYMIYNNTLIVYPNSEGESLNITCSVEDVFSNTITIQGLNIYLLIKILLLIFFLTFSTHWSSRRC